MKTKGIKEQLVQSALRLMLDKGYAGTTVDEICDAAGASKGSFYYFFQTKEDIGLAALESFYERAQQLIQSGTFMEIEDPIERAFGYLDHAEAVCKKIWGDGCLLGTFATDLAYTRPAIRKRVIALFDRTTAAVAQIFEPIAALRRNGPTADQLAERYLAILEGSIVMAKAHNDWKRIPRGLQGFREYLRLLVA